LDTRKIEPRAPEAKKSCVGLQDEAQLAGQHIDRENLKRRCNV